MSALDDLISGLAGMYDHEHPMVDPARAELAALRAERDALREDVREAHANICALVWNTTSDCECDVCAALRGKEGT